MTFSFDTQGYNDISFGIKYDFNESFTSGELFGVFKCPFINSDYMVTISYDNLDGIFDNGINTKFSMYESDILKFSGKVSRTPGKTNIEATTPYDGWKEVIMMIDVYLTRIVQPIWYKLGCSVSSGPKL